MRFMIEVIITDGGLPDFMGASCTGSVFCAPVVSVHISIYERCEEVAS
jgi:hypothetical protein